MGRDERDGGGVGKEMEAWERNGLLASLSFALGWRRDEVEILCRVSGTLMGLSEVFPSSVRYACVCITGTRYDCTLVSGR